MQHFKQMYDENLNCILILTSKNILNFSTDFRCNNSSKHYNLFLHKSFIVTLYQEIITTFVIKYKITRTSIDTR